MKRLVVAFHPRRQDPSESPLAVPPVLAAPVAAADVKKRPGFFSKPRVPAELHVAPNGTAGTVYSSSSSEGSAAQTPDPDDDHEPDPSAPARTTSRWSSWMRSKASPKPPRLAAVWEPTRVPVEASSSSPPSTPESDDDSDHYDDEPPLPPPPVVRPSRPSPSPPGRSSRVLQPASALRSHMNMRAITLSSIIPPLSPPPLLHLPSGPLFPRSSNPARTLQPLVSTRTIMHKTVLLRRLESQTLSRSENESIAAFGHRPKPVVPKTRRRGLEEEAMSDVKKVRFYSRGLQSWMDRPCYEERCVLWAWDANAKQVVRRQIVGSDKAVASLEFTEGLEALAGYGVDSPSLSAPVPHASSKSALLSPLRIASPLPPEVNSPGSSTPNASTGPSTPTNVLSPNAPPRKILRFLPEPQEDAEDNVPLGYQILTKRERERIIEERERQIREEERMKKVYAAEVAAARARREGARAGSHHELEMAKDRRTSYTRPAYDPSLANSRRVASEADVEPRAASRSGPPSIVNGQSKSRPSSIKSGWTGHGSSTQRTPPLPSPLPSPPPHTRSHTTPSNEELTEAKLRRRMSNFSESGTSTRSRFPSAPSAPTIPPVPVHTFPRSYSSGGAPMGPIPVMPVPMPMYVMPGTPHFFMQQQQQQQQQQMLMPQHASMAPLLPPVRPGLPVSRSAEGLRAPRAHADPSPGAARPAQSPRRATGGIDETKRASRISVQVPPVSFRQATPNYAGGVWGARPTPLSR
ncbi:hypothetical protein K439DRAFT_902937 [Ramaria rubella]|nr:hypothetical protein K439DRAFT_902937 [Ramaria rubella]